MIAGPQLLYCLYNYIIMIKGSHSWLMCRYQNYSQDWKVWRNFKLTRCQCYFAMTYKDWMYLCTVFWNIQSRVARRRSLAHAFPQVLTAWARTLKASLVPSFKPWYVSTDVLLYTSSLELIQISWNSASFDQHLSSLYFLVSGNHHSTALLQVKKSIFFLQLPHLRSYGRCLSVSGFAVLSEWYHFLLY